jgi:DNA-binding response OmpR family regulator
MKNILIIDDDPDVITVLQVLLKKNGYEVITAHNEEEAYYQLELHKPHLVIMDVLLSGADGRVICKKLKSGDNSKHIPIIMFSAHPGAQKNMLDCGADDFIPKPFQGNLLLERIENLLKKTNQILG